MVSKKVTLVNAQGFHMRPASVFATAMGKYASSVTIKFNGNDYNAMRQRDRAGLRRSRRERSAG